MSQYRSNHQQEMQRKLIKFTVLVFLVVVALCVAGGILSGLPKRRAEQEARRTDAAVAAIFRGDNTVPTDAEPLIRRPYTVYGKSTNGTWVYKEGVRGTDLVTNENITPSLSEARTCVLIWPDTANSKKSDRYYWGTNTTRSHDAYFCPVYMTIIDRETGLRYADIKLGSVPTTGGKYSTGYSGPLYSPDKEWSTFDLDSWLSTHWLAGNP